MASETSLPPGREPPGHEPPGPELPGPGAPPSEMTLFEHLAELRSVIVQSLGAAAIGSVLAWFVSEPALDLLVRPAIGATGDLVFLAPTGAFMLRLKVALGLGVLAAAPFIVWRIWAFVVPGLLQRERRLLLPVVASSLALFYAGAAFGYLVILPVSMGFLLAFGTEYLTPMISGGAYFNFALRLALAFGTVFQFPLVIALLTYWEILGPDFLKKYWRYGVVLVFVFSAMLTPPDVASQVLMAGPVLVLYFASMVIAKAIAARRRR